MKISAARAQAVKDYFVIFKRISSDRITINNLGDSQNTIIGDNDFNRRVDVYLYYND
jgi:outer membrane protein OmpA-like peptidoglycan-associated protein